MTFSQDWYAKAPFLEMWWQGWPIVKCPLDLHQYQEIIWQTRPDVIVETGTFSGGSALFMAHMQDLIDHGEVLSIDIRTGTELPEHSRIRYFEGMSSTDLRVLEEVKKIASGRKTMVVLDSDHSRPHVLKELKAYAPIVTKGCYLIVEDTNPDAYHRDQVGEYDGYPGDAVKEWQPSNNGFEKDERRERFIFSQNPGGYLRRVR